MKKESTSPVEHASEPLPAHHPFGMSTWPSLVKCPAYQATSETIDKFGEAGTAAHETLDTGESSGKDDLDAVAAWGVGEIAKLFAKYPPIGDVSGEKDGGRVTIHRPEGDPFRALDGIFGTGDRFWVDVDGIPHILDFKTFSRKGREHIPQLAGYAFAEFPLEQQVMCHVLSGGTRTVYNKMLSKFDIESICYDVMFAVTTGKTAERCAGKHCTYCVHRPDCYSYAEHGRIQVEEPNTVLARLPLFATRGEIAANAQLAAKFLAWSTKADKAIKETKDNIKAAIRDGVTIADFDTGKNWVIKTINGRAQDVTLAEVFNIVGDDLPDNWQEKLAVSKTAAVKAFGDHVASVFPVPTQERLTAEKI